MALFAFLAGMAFVFACLATAMAIAEHQRAKQVEQALTELYADLSRRVNESASELAGQEAMIRAVAAATVPKVYPYSEKVHIVVPGPRTAQ